MPVEGFDDASKNINKKKKRKKKRTSRYAKSKRQQSGIS